MMSRRHNDPLDPHERARTLASNGLDEALAPTDASWLDEHLGGCDDCRARADAYAANREFLRALPEPEPPRDLWVRTSAALDRERTRRAGTARAGSGRAPRRMAPARWSALAGIAAVLAVGLLVGRAILPSGVGTQPVALASGAPSTVPDLSIQPAATPLAVPAADVAWVSRAPDGTYTVNVASVTSVCPQDAAPDCAPLGASARQVISLEQQPGSVVFAPTLGQAAIIEASAKQSGGSILVVPFDRSAPAPSESPSPEPTSPTSSTEPPTATPSAQTTPQPPASTEPTPGTTEPVPTPVATLVAPESPAPTAVSAVAIISGIIVVGGDAAYSPDGAWLAFSARSATGTDGPDVYVWHVGDPAARPLTTDHATIFSSWVGGEILASRALAVQPLGSPASVGSPSPSSSPETSSPETPSPEAFIPSSFALDPTTGMERSLGGSLGWRPVVDPTGRWVAYWTGTLRFDPTVSAWVPDEGRLVVDTWYPSVVDATGAVPSPSPTPTPSPSPSPTANPQPLLDPRPGEAIRDWTMRWDPTGTYIAAWVGDPLVEGLGRLSLIAIDQATGRPSSDAVPLLRDAPALAGFAIGDGRLAWATPSGQDGEGSRLEVLAWQGTDAGKTRGEPAPPDETILVVR